MESKDAGTFFDEALDDEETKKILEADKKMTACFKRVFSTSNGRIVLQQILTDLRFFDECVTDADKALNNYAKFMIFKRLKVDNKSKITKLLLDID